MNEEDKKIVANIVLQTDVAKHQTIMVDALEKIADCVAKMAPGAANRAGAMLGAAVGGVAQRHGVENVRGLLRYIAANEEFWQAQREIAAKIGNAIGRPRT
jgi:nicotinamide mononucleotide (NMN) deamidase PncC